MNTNINRVHIQQIIFSIFIGVLAFTCSLIDVAAFRQLDDVPRIFEVDTQPLLAATFSCPSVSQPLAIGSKDIFTNGAVSALQQFLAQDSTLYPEGEVTGFFGKATERAVKRFQVRYGIATYGTPDTTGYGAVGKQTRTKMQELCTGTASLPTLQKQTGGTFSLNGVASVAKAIQNNVTTYSIVLKDGTARTVATPKGTNRILREQLFRETGYTGSVSKLMAKTKKEKKQRSSGGGIYAQSSYSTYSQSSYGPSYAQSSYYAQSAYTPTPVVNPPYTLADVSTVTGGPTRTIVDGRHVYSVLLKTKKYVTILACSVCTAEKYKKAFTDSGYTGDVAQLTAMAGGSSTYAQSSYSTYSQSSYGPSYAQSSYYAQSAYTSVSVPTCDAFTATPPTLPSTGGNVLLTWNTSNATAASINQSIGTVAVDGTKSVSLTATKTYTLTATNAAGTAVTCVVTVTVAPPPLPNAPISTSTLTVYDFNKLMRGQYSSGSIIVTASEGFRYKTLPANTLDYDLITELGSRLLVLPSADGSLDPRAFGAQSDNSTNDAVPFQRAINALQRLGNGNNEQTPGGGVISFTEGTSVLGHKLNLTTDTQLNFGKSELALRSIDSAFDIGWSSIIRASDTYISGGRMVLYSPNAVAFAVQNSYAPVFRDINLRLKEKGQLGFWIKGNAKPNGPYYGVMDNIRVFGNAQPGSNQTGIRFSGAGTDGSDGVNRWSISNIRHFAAMDYCMDIQNMHGQAFDIVNLESCYNTGIRFNYRDRADYEGLVTEDGATSVITDAKFLSTKDARSASIKILTGANAGHTQNVSQLQTNKILFANHFPFPFKKGDKYQVFYSKARNIELSHVTMEHAGTFVDFRAGARDIKVRTSFVTLLPTSYYFKREIEDTSNTIASRNEVFSVEITTPASGQQIVIPTNIDISENGWIDAVSVTNLDGTLETDGLINLSVSVNGKDQGITPLLTQYSPKYSRRVRKDLRGQDFIRPGDKIFVTVKENSAILSSKKLNVNIFVGHL